MNIDHHIANQLKTLRLGGFLETLALRLTQAREDALDHLTFLELNERLFQKRSEIVAAPLSLFLVHHLPIPP